MGMKGDDAGRECAAARLLTELLEQVLVAAMDAVEHADRDRRGWPGGARAKLCERERRERHRANKTISGAGSAR
jgi:hypothetical protein